MSPETFAKVYDRALALEVSPGRTMVDIVEAWARGEPPPIFIGAEEHS